MKFFAIFTFGLSLLFMPFSGLRYEVNLDNVNKESAPKEVKMFMSEIYADSILNTLTLDEKIAQLIMMDVYPNKNETYYKTIDRWVSEKKIGGILFFRGQAAEISKLSNRYYSQASIPLWIGMDAEWGVSMRVDSVRTLPKAMTLGAIRDNEIVREYGYLVGQQCRRLNININMAPVVDVNNNPKNPVINYRSFGESRYNVAQKAIAYYLGMNDAGVIAVGKHFPGHGNTDTDSHYELPIIKDSMSEIDSIHLYPFKEMIKYGVPGIMSAHLYVHAIDNTPNLASSLSPKILNNLLFETMGFKGILLTDALNMKGVSKYFVPGQIEVMALMAGNDILLMPPKPQVSIDSIKVAVKDGRIKESMIDEKVKKLLSFKYLYLNDFNLQTNSSRIPQELNSKETSNFIFRVFAEAATLLKNQNQYFPLNSTVDKNIAVITVGRSGETNFFKGLSKYSNSKHFSLSANPTDNEIVRIENSLTNFDQVIVCLYGLTNNPSRSYGVTAGMNNLLNKLVVKQNTSLILYGNAYALNFVNSTDKLSSIVVTYEHANEAEDAVALAVAGVNSFKGILPVSLNNFKLGTGIYTKSETGFFDAKPDFKINTNVLNEVDAIVQSAINQKAFPGCQIVMAKDGKIFFNKSYGHHTYEKTREVKNSDIYDLASITKILATTTAVMKLFDEGKIKLDDKLSKHLTWLSGTPVGNVTITEVMTHQAGFKSWLPFYRFITSNEVLKAQFFSEEETEGFDVKIADNFYMNSTYRDSIYKRISDEPLLRKQYRYSCLGFLLLKEIVEVVAEQDFEQFLSANFYLPMKLHTLTFNPLTKFSKERIPPTEDDTYFRNQLVHGYVHDQAAAMLSGVAGNAGLFGSATDVAAMMQMFLDNGYFEGKQYVDSMTVAKFTSRQFSNNRRGLGFDKPANVAKNGNAAMEASPFSFGHTGFTGTIAWADPKNKLVFVFLSNRIHPNAENRLLMSLDVRAKIQSISYRAVS